MRRGVLSLAALFVAVVAGLAVGPFAIGLDQVAQALLAKAPGLGVDSPLSATQEAVVFELRAPRVVLAALVGGMLAVAGASYQAVFRNPLADPYILGIAGGAGLGATVAITCGTGPRSTLLPLAAFIGASCAVGAAYALARTASGERRSPAALILAGVTVATFCTAVQTFIQHQDGESLGSVYAWLLGHLDSAQWRDVGLAAPYVLVSAGLLLLHRRILDVLLLGDDEAAGLGINVRRVRGTVVGAATLGTAAAVAVSGLIGFIGIIVPHAVRLATRALSRTLLPLSFVLGGAFLVLADAGARTVLAPAELPVGIVTAILGTPFFALVLRTSRVAA